MVAIGEQLWSFMDTQQVYTTQRKNKIKNLGNCVHTFQFKVSFTLPLQDEEPKEVCV